MKAFALAVCVALVLVSCGSGNFTPYEGVQQKWPTSQGGLVNRRYSIPIYYGPPPNPYIILGTLSNDDIQDAADDAKRAGADAVIVISARDRAGAVSGGNATGIGESAFGAGISGPNLRSRFSVAAIRWTKGNEVGAATGPAGQENIRKLSKGKYPKGIPGDQPGMVRSPYTQRLYDVRNVPHNALVRDVDADKLFVNP